MGFNSGFKGLNCSNSVLLVNSHYHSTSEQYSHLVPVPPMLHNPGNCHCPYVRHFLFSFTLFVFTYFIHFFVGSIPMRYERFHDEILERFIIVKGTSHILVHLHRATLNTGRFNFFILYPLI